MVTNGVVGVKDEGNIPPCPQHDLIKASWVPRDECADIIDLK